MRRYIIKRLLLFIPTILGVSIVIFAILRIIPGDVATLILSGADGDASFTQEQKIALEKQLGLDRPIPIQYIDWVWGVMRFELGESWQKNTPVAGIMKRKLPVTLQLAFVSAIIVIVTSIPIGVASAVFQDKWPDYVLRGGAVIALAMPGFFVGMLIILFLSTTFAWIPPLGFTHLWQDPFRSLQQLFFPAAALGFHSAGYILRMTRAQLLEVLREDYIRTARAKGLAERAVIRRHAIRNALLPVVTLLGFQLAFLLGGTIVMEAIFNLPGLGQSFVDAVRIKDLPIVQAYVIYLVLIILSINLLVDLSYAWLDPRIQYS